MIGLGSDKDIGFLQKGRKMVSLSNRCVIKRLPTVPVISSISPKLVHWGVPSKYPFESLQSTFVILRSFNTRFIFCLIFSILIPFINWNCGHFILLIHKSLHLKNAVCTRNFVPKCHRIQRHSPSYKCQHPNRELEDTSNATNA